MRDPYDDPFDELLHKIRERDDLIVLLAAAILRTNPSSSSVDEDGTIHLELDRDDLVPLKRGTTIEVIDHVISHKVNISVRHDRTSIADNHYRTMLVEP